jgi:protein O-GlcNAc transferase
MSNYADSFALALQYQRQGNHYAAVLQYQEVLRLKPDSVEAHFNLGNSLRLLGKLNEACACYEHALRLKPDNIGALNNLGAILVDQLRLDEAAARFQQALRLKPDSAETLVNLGNANLRHEKLDEAIGCYRQALRLKPNFADGWYNLANSLKRQGSLDEAIKCYREALRLKPTHAEACINLGNVLSKQEMLDEAILWYREALHIKSAYETAYFNWGNALVQQEKLDEALECFRKAIGLKPDYAEAHANLGSALIDLGEPEMAIASLREALRLDPNLAAARSSLLFGLNYHPGVDPEAVYAEHLRWGLQARAKCDVQSSTCEDGNFTLDRGHRTSNLARILDPERRLRIGYMSPDLRGHALIRYFEPVLAHHDPRQVEVFCYAEVSRPDAVTSRLQSLVSNWRWTCYVTDTEVAQRIRDDEIDILVDLAGHTRRTRLLVFAHKPAPVQATWLGYMNTTGLTAMDYRITDEVLDPTDKFDVRSSTCVVESVSSTIDHRPPNSSSYDTEELVRLPGGMCCFAPPPDAPAVAPLPALRNNCLTFGSLHNLFKINGRVLELWSSVLQAVPTARLLLFHHTLKGSACTRIGGHFASRGIASDRLEIRQGSSFPGYLEVYGEIDVSLDTFPCTGGVTTCESLWMGVPILSLRGVRPAGRHSASHLARVGLNEWAVDTPKEYVALAVRLAGELDNLARLRAGLRDRMLPTLCDAQGFTRGLEAAYRAMWRRWCGEQNAF